MPQRTHGLAKKLKAVKPSQTWSEFARECKVSSTFARGSRGKYLNMGSETSVGMPYTGQGVPIREYGGGEGGRGLEYGTSGFAGRLYRFP
ncbi:hypothetical protein H112_07115 [Trichophyton rubrum D6]|uniref:Uncharacterized protein n=1 Tax=Trichophyton rubrum CBS 288.86 TaxID=1215330 RepID=A0A022VTP1_TRIRU|nr:hypothetical protein H100_07137 [Trichophyton rubrum MR850]EZF38700.1 hypothetical protein H102_07100 [Trichophyton rubrum CBS 100081]EZF49324.1 hypothetical protein H103_07121 [Trichophyton rubrum CBS 288.86]EZF60046.1 hypothetical protein H104_07077 [Trichophyton rubrum CBS 289.86]EZF81259.1 hypothetical protein H110_07121 [Trichophyton rubrum MR1448]EZF91999.1 hypothetical protein H113_07172 [Trichophyton rubrum MR1459]EZG13473.1 hypothetical protein H107_07281 [Trichophyton rubrum CBS 